MFRIGVGKRVYNFLLYEVRSPFLRRDQGSLISSVDKTAFITKKYRL